MKVWKNGSMKVKFFQLPTANYAFEGQAAK